MNPITQVSLVMNTGGVSSENDHVPGISWIGRSLYLRSESDPRAYIAWARPGTNRLTKLKRHKATSQKNGPSGNDV